MYYEKCVMRDYYRVRQRSGKTPGLFLFPLRLEILYIPYSGDVGTCYDFKVQKSPGGKFNKTIQNGKEAV